MKLGPKDDAAAPEDVPAAPALPCSWSSSPAAAPVLLLQLLPAVDEIIAAAAAGSSATVPPMTAAEMLPPIEPELERRSSMKETLSSKRTRSEVVSSPDNRLEFSLNYKEI